jgi:hypothetical protein
MIAPDVTAFHVYPLIAAGLTHAPDDSSENPFDLFRIALSGRAYLLHGAALNISRYKLALSSKHLRQKSKCQTSRNPFSAVGKITIGSHSTSCWRQITILSL